MAPVRVGRWFRVGQILDLFRQMDCEVRIAEDAVEEAPGEGAYGVRYILDPDGNRFVPIFEADDELVNDETVKHWEDRLGIVIPRPPSR